LVFDRLLRPEIPPPVFTAVWSPPHAPRPQELFGLFYVERYILCVGCTNLPILTCWALYRGKSRIVMFRQEHEKIPPMDAAIEGIFCTYV
jgi:hypothetical protein